MLCSSIASGLDLTAVSGMVDTLEDGFIKL